jgi:hypothetical protein
MAVHIHPLKIPPRYYKPLGQIAAGSALAEALISSIIWHIHGIKEPEEGRLFTYRPSAKQRLDLFKVSIKRFAKPSIKNDLKGFHQRATDLNKQRNKFVHGLWGRMPTEDKTWKVFFHHDADDMLWLKREITSVEQVKRVAKQVEQLNRDMKKWMAKNHVPPP